VRVTQQWEFFVLGPLEIRSGGEVVALRSVKQRVLLSSLLLRVNHPVPADELIDHLWGDAPPRGARATLQTYVMRLRTALREPNDPPLVRTEPGGYAIHLAPEQLDLTRFQHLLAEAGTARRADDAARESALLTEALRLWRGPAFADVRSLGIQHGAALALTEQRWEVVGRRNDVLLRLGEHQRLVGELHALVVEQPLRERFWAQLVRALHADGQQAQALEVYRRASAVLAEELGVDPNEELRELHRLVLAASTAPPADASAPVPVPVPAVPIPAVPLPGGAHCRLPPALPELTGRDDEVATLSRELRSTAGGGRAWVITGAGGVGKTSLALHVAHLVRAGYPDGQLYLNLRGTDHEPVDPATAVDRLLRGLGVVPAAIPASLEERIDLYLGRLSDQRVLIVLDNAAGEAQVRPLLPGTSAAAVLVTSRVALAGLEAARVVSLEVLPPADALGLLAGALGVERVTAEPVAAADIVRYCGGLPLALRVAAARLVARPHWRLAELAERLSDERRRFDELCLGDLDVRASLACSYDGLDELHRRAFRSLALLDVPDFPAWVAAPLLEVGLDRAEDVVEALVDARLVEFVGRDVLGRSRYRLHDLLRAFGREAADEADVRALRALVDLWLDLARAADRKLPHQGLRPIPADRAPGPLAAELASRLLDDAATWFDVEWPSVRATADQAAALGLDERVWWLAASSAAFCDLRARFDDWEQINRLGLARVAAADRADGTVRWAEAVLVQQRGLLRCRQHRFGDAEADFDRARDGFERTGDAQGTGYAWHGLGWMHEWSGDVVRARECHQRAMARFREVGDGHGEVEVLCSLGAIGRRAGDLDAAGEHLAAAVALAHELDDDLSVLGASWELGRLRLVLGDLARAEELLRTSLRTAVRLGDPDLAAHVRLSLAETLLDGDRLDAAHHEVRRALVFFEERDDRTGLVLAWRLISRLHLSTGDTDAALEVALRALAAARTLTVPRQHGIALRQLAEVHAARGETAEALRYREEGAERLRAAGCFAEAAALERGPSWSATAPPHGDRGRAR
jgi:DNA-binding SARP family transcriptional activator